MFYLSIKMFVAKCMMQTLAEKSMGIHIQLAIEHLA